MTPPIIVQPNGDHKLLMDAVKGTSPKIVVTDLRCLDLPILLHEARLQVVVDALQLLQESPHIRRLLRLRLGSSHLSGLRGRRKANCIHHRGHLLHNSTGRPLALLLAAAIPPPSSCLTWGIQIHVFSSSSAKQIKMQNAN
ncbi:MAG: hypothetical protein AAF587_45060 [Bacteroidota bacterium]